MRMTEAGPISVKDGRTPQRSKQEKYGKEPTATGAEGASAAPQDGPTSSNRLMVMIVEDNEDAAESMALLVQSWGHEVLVAKDGRNALELLRDKRPEIVLIDIGLPSMNGYEVARRIRAMPEMAEVFLVALTGYGREQDRNAALQAGFNIHLVKPLEPDRLQTLLSSLR